MKMKVIEETPEVLRFEWDGVGVQVANVIRRTAMGDVPTLAVDKVMIYENSSIFFDEYIAHRLGLVALKADTSSITPDEKIVLTLDKEGPCMVHGSDLIPPGSDIEVIGKEAPIAKLKEGQKLRLEAVATVNRGEIHAKWQPGLVSYQGYPVLNFDAKNVKNPKEVENSCPTNVLKISGNKAELTNPANCTLCNACRDIADGQGISVEPHDSKVIFSVESFGQVHPRDVLKQAADVLIDKSNNFIESFKKAK
ncbi:MAG: DNA-directed RNA polymerase subunit D [Candidatus Diapherotrites archaeon]|nr:DNA-directed RNA polymerase subunit D [Candidatus Diapherotrites archaeon]